MKKKIFWLGGIFGFLLLLILALPFLVDFSYLKPQIKAAVAEHTQADLEFSSAKLTLFPSIGINLKDVVLENRDPDFSGTKTFAVGNLTFKVGLLNLIRGEFRGSILVNQPEIRFIQKQGRNNLAAIAKPENAGSKASAGTADKAPAEPSPDAKEDSAAVDPQASKDKIEALKNKVSITAMEINDALVIFNRDDGTDVKIQGLNVHIYDIGLEQDIKTHIFTDVAVQAAGAQINGPLDFSLTSRITMKEGAFQKLDFNGKLDLSQLNIAAAQNAFTKKSGIPLNLNFEGYAYADNVVLKTMNFQIHNINASMDATIQDFNILNTNLNFKLKTDEISQLADLLPKHKDLLMKGSLGVELKVNGALSEYEKLAIQASVDSQLSGSDFAIRLQTTNLLPPRLNLKIISQNIDIDALLGPFMKEDVAQDKAPVAATPKKDAGSETKKASPASPETTDIPAEEFALTDAQKQMLMGSDAKVSVELNQLVYHDLKLQSFSIDFRLEDLKATLNKFNVAMFGGMIRSSGAVNLEKVPVQYQGKVDLAKVDANRLIEFINKDYANTMTGMMSVNLEVSGQGSTKDTAFNALNGKGNFILHEGRFNSASISQLMGQEVDHYTKDLNPAKKLEENYEKIKARIPAALLGKLNLDQEKNKITAELKKMENISLGDKLNKSRDLKDVKGAITIDKGVINFTTRHEDASGIYDMNQNVKLDGTLNGSHVFTASAALKTQLEKTSQYASLLYDQKKNLVLPFKTAGTIDKPVVKVDFAALRQQFDNNSKNSFDGPLQKKGGSQKEQLLSIGKDKLKAELDKQKDKNKKEADKQKQKATDEGKDKLKEKLKGKIPGF